MKRHAATRSSAINKRTARRLCSIRGRKHRRRKEELQRTARPFSQPGFSFSSQSSVSDPMCQETCVPAKRALPPEDSVSLFPAPTSPACVHSHAVGGQKRHESSEAFRVCHG